uniref:ATPase ASNA1 homolog n=1 Tax=Acrobeloides nanus TaxID=290746 RepID=A0A914C7F1_9BILA
MAAETLEPSLKNVIDQTTLKWIFVGGKGGVGKTTCSCSLAVQLANVRRNVLIISTDPAHNISDAFSQKFTKTPTPVNGFTNLFAMEVDGSATETNAFLEDSSDDIMSMGKNMIAQLAGGLPGIDEAMSFAQMIRLVQSMDFDVIVFDTAPTGHTLRLLQFPTLLENALSKFISLQNQFMPMISQIGGILGINDFSSDETSKKLNDTLEIVRTVNSQFKDPELTTFVCVCIAEFLSMYETERLIQELTKQDIDSHNLIVNQLLFPDRNQDGSISCKKCNSRFKIQQKYLNQICDLYDEFHIIQLPLLEHEVRGTEQIKGFSKMLIDPTLKK